MAAGFSDASSERRGATLKPPQTFPVLAAAAPGSPTSSSATATDASGTLWLAGDRFDEAASAAVADNPLSRLANQLRKLDAKTLRTTAAASSALGSAASAATNAVAYGGGGDPASYRPVYCEPGLTYAIYRTLPMRNELDQYLEIAAKRRRKGRVPFVDFGLPGQSWMKRELRARRPLPNLSLAPPAPPVTLGAQASRGFSMGAGGGGGGGGGGLGPSRLVRLSTFAEVERQRTVTYELQTKLKEMLDRK